MRKPWALVAITKHGVDLGLLLRQHLKDSELFVPHKFKDLAPDATTLPLPLTPWIGEHFQKYDAFVFVISVGAVVRMISPFLESKKKDPAVICVDDDGKFAISTLSGHVGRGNVFTERVAQILGAQSVITTASDVRQTIPVDILGRDFGWRLHDDDHFITSASAAVVNEEPVAVIAETGEPWWTVPKPVPSHISSFKECPTETDSFRALLWISDRNIPKLYPDLWPKTVVYHPKSLHLGFGCDRGLPYSFLKEKVLEFMDPYVLQSVQSISSIELKRDEESLLRLCSEMGWILNLYSKEQLSAMETPHPSLMVEKHVGVKGVAEPSCLLSSQKGSLLKPKTIFKDPSTGRNLTLALARKNF